VRPRRRIYTLTMYGGAGLGCALVWFGWLYFTPGAHDARAAMGSLQQLAPAALEEATLTPSAALPSVDPQPSAASSTTQAPSQRSGPRAAVSATASGRAKPTLDPDSPEGRARTLVDEGSALAIQGRLGLAESAYQKALRADPDHPSALAALVRVHIARRDGAEAVRWAKRLITKQPGGDSQLLLGDAFALRGDADAARAAWTSAARGGNAAAKKRLP
jgi:tetratricopeptide (TPR) repeat protein